MPVNEPILFDPVGGPKRYPAPDYEAIGKVARVWVPDDELVGWIVWQDPDRIGWLSLAAPADLGYVVREIVEDLLRDGVNAGRPARDVYDEVLRRTLHTTPTDEFLPAFTADVRREWGT